MRLKSAPCANFLNQWRNSRRPNRSNKRSVEPTIERTVPPVPPCECIQFLHIFRCNSSSSTKLRSIWQPARRTTTDEVEDISDVNGPSKFQRISIYERQNLVNLERRGWPVTPWWRGQGRTPNLIKTFWITALRALGSTEMKIKSFWITAWRALGSTEMKIKGFWIAALRALRSTEMKFEDARVATHKKIEEDRTNV